MRTALLTEQKTGEVDLRRAQLLKGDREDVELSESSMRQHREVELTYFIPLRLLQPGVDLSKLGSRVKIDQRYFPKERLRAIARQIAELVDNEQAEDLPFSHARIRRVQSYRSEDFFLGAKGRLGAWDRHARFEFEPAISQEDYRRLKQLATAGRLTRNRYEVLGTVSDASRHRVATRAEIDIVLRAGIDFRRVNPNLPGFALIDIELPRPGLVEQLRAGRHSFDFLDCAVEISAMAKSDARVMSKRRLARRGIDAQAEEFIRDFTRVCEKKAA